MKFEGINRRGVSEVGDGEMELEGGSVGSAEKQA